MGELSSFINIEETIARSQQIIQESIELSQKNQQRKDKLNHQVRASLPSAEKASRSSILVRASEQTTTTSQKDLLARNGTKNSGSRERSPIKEHSMRKFDESLASEANLSKSFTHNEEIRLLKVQVAEMKAKLVNIENANHSLKYENTVLSQSNRQASNYKNTIQSQQNEIERLRDELSSTHSELNRVLQRLNDQQTYAQSIEEELGRYKEDLDGSYGKGTQVYKDLYERYVELLERARTGQRQHHLPLKEGDSKKHTSQSFGLQSVGLTSHNSTKFANKISSLEQKLENLEGKYASQAFENTELKVRLMNLLEQTGANSESEHANSPSARALGSTLYDSDSSEERLPQRPMYTHTETMRTPKAQPRKSLKKIKKPHEVSADKRRSSKVSRHGRRQRGAFEKK